MTDDIPREDLLHWLIEIEDRARTGDHPTLTPEFRRGALAATGAIRTKMSEQVLATPTVPVTEVHRAPRLRSNGTVTSFEAAVTQTAERSQEKYAAIYTALLEAPEGLTDDDLDLALVGRHWNRDTVRLRRGDLKAYGWVRESGETREGLRTGSKMTVWVAVPPLRLQSPS